MSNQLSQSDPGVMMGKPVLGGTRVTIETITLKLSSCEPLTQMLDSHPRFTRLPKEDAIKIMQLYAKEDASFNIVGKESVETALMAGIIDKNCIHKIQGIPFALTLL